MTFVSSSGKPSIGGCVSSAGKIFDGSGSTPLGNSSSSVLSNSAGSRNVEASARDSRYATRGERIGKAKYIGSEGRGQKAEVAAPRMHFWVLLSD